MTPPPKRKMDQLKKKPKLTTIAIKTKPQQNVKLCTACCGIGKRHPKYGASGRAFWGRKRLFILKNELEEKQMKTSCGRQ